MKDDSWTIPNEILLDGSSLALKNTDRLLKDARILFDNKRYSTSLALSVLALEEFGKCLLLFEAMTKRSKVTSNMWRKHFMNHNVKLNAILRIIELFPPSPEYKDELDKESKELAKLVEKWGATKIQAIYVDWDNQTKNWFCYDEKVDEDKMKDSREVLNLVERWFKAFSEHLGEVVFATKQEKIEALRSGKAYCFCHDCGLVMINERELAGHLKTNHRIAWYSS